MLHMPQAHSVMLAGPPCLPSPKPGRRVTVSAQMETWLKTKAQRENKAKAAPCEWPFYCSLLFGQWQKYTELTFNSWMEGFSMTLEALITKRDKRPPACSLILPHPALCFIPEVVPWPCCPRGCDPCPVQSSVPTCTPASSHTPSTHSLYRCTEEYPSVFSTFQPDIYSAGLRF